MACRPYNTGRCLQLRLFNCPNFGVHFSDRLAVDEEENLIPELGVRFSWKTFLGLTYLQTSHDQDPSARHRQTRSMEEKTLLR